jgi:hypothetical protein
MPISSVLRVHWQAASCRHADQEHPERPVSTQGNLRMFSRGAGFSGQPSGKTSFEKVRNRCKQVHLERISYQPCFLEKKRI